MKTSSYFWGLSVQSRARQMQIFVISRLVLVIFVARRSSTVSSCVFGFLSLSWNLSNFVCKSVDIFSLSTWFYVVADSPCTQLLACVPASSVLAQGFGACFRSVYFYFEGRSMSLSIYYYVQHLYFSLHDILFLIVYAQIFVFVQLDLATSTRLDSNSSFRQLNFGLKVQANCVLIKFIHGLFSVDVQHQSTICSCLHISIDCTLYMHATVNFTVLFPS